ncbi:MAG: guanylate kinase [bacterium]|nr:guanylate kinase [bacterium]
MGLIRPALFVLSAPSGSGKTSLIKEALGRLKFLTLSLSTTTRPPRAGETEGVDYHFTDPDDFSRSIDAGEFLEWACVYGNYYGTSAKRIAEAQDRGLSVLLDIDVQGAMQLKELPGFLAHYVFIKPPSIEELERRLTGRGSESPETLAKRLGNAVHELTFQDQYDSVILNDDLITAEDKFLKLLIARSINLDLARKESKETLLSALCRQSGDLRIATLVDQILESPAPT